MNRLRIQFVAPEEIVGYDPSDEDTEAMVRHAGGADVLVHEAYNLKMLMMAGRAVHTAVRRDPTGASSA